MLGFEFNQEQEMFRQAVRAFADREIRPLADECDRTETFPVSVYRRLGELGYLAVGAPQELGGMAGGKVMECIFLEELSRVSGGIGGTIAVSPFIVTPVIWKHGTEEHKHRYVIPTIRGEKIASIAMTEPNAGSDVAGVQTTATRDGDDYVLNGSKIFITNGPIADYVLVVAYTDRTKGIRGMSTLIVERGTRGFAVARKLAKATNRSSETAELTFDNCRVPASNMVGAEEGGFQRVMHGLNAERVVSAACGLGLARAAYEASLKYARERVQFGKPIGHHQAIAFRLADMAISVQASHLLIYSAAWLHDQGRPYVKEASMAKLYASEAAVQVCRDAVQIHGGYGVMSEFPIARYMQDALVGTIVAGTSEIQRLIIAKEIGLSVS